MYKLGAASEEIAGPEPAVGMLGYGIGHQRVEGMALPLEARAFFIDHAESGRRAALVVSDLCFISQSLRRGVVARLAADHADLGLDEHQLLLSATHTHSGPGGYSHHLLYNLTIPGFSPVIYERIVAGIVRAIARAAEGAVPGRLRLASGPIPEDQPVAFQRALASYNRNPEVNEAATKETAHLAIDREMTVLRLEAEGGRPLGSVAWFGVHGCSMHSDNRLLHPDNKGCASRAVEAFAREAWGAPDFVAAFPQTTPGDVTPNFRRDKRRGFAIGIHDEDHESAEANGRIQADHALRLWDAAGRSAPLTGPPIGRLRYADHGAVEVDPAHSDGREGLTTAPATLGMSMLMGTLEGPGPLLRLPWVPWLLNRSRAGAQGVKRLVGRGASPQGPKYPFLQTHRGGAGRAFGMFLQGRPILPGFVDPVVARVRALAKHDGVGTGPWTEAIVPVQLFTVGRLAVAALPGEPTTMAGRRVRATVLPHLAAGLGVEHVVVAGYANGYGGYVTTHEEYQRQGYEGGSTLYGQWTLAAFQTRLAELARELAAAPEDRDASLGTVPPGFSDEALALRAFPAAG